MKKGKIMLYYILTALSLAGVLSYIVCFAKISFYRIKKSRLLQKLSVYFILCLALCIAGLICVPEVSGNDFLVALHFICLMGTIFLSLFFLVFIPSEVIKFEHDKNELKPYLIGLFSLLTSIAIVIFLHKAHFKQF